MKKILLILGIITIFGCSNKEMNEASNVIKKETAIEVKQTSKFDTHIDNFPFEKFHRTPTQWGENVSGVKTRFKTDEKEIALTFDACGGDYGNDFDDSLISLLREENIPATLFINEQWIAQNKEVFLELSMDPLFQIENHGSEHRPLSVAGGNAWGIQATNNPEEAYEEIMSNHATVESLTNKEMTLFRSGTAYYDEIAVQLANTLSYEVVNFDILGDAGATYTGEQVKNALLQAQKGSIALLHMNQPESGTAEGVRNAIPLLKEKGFTFVLLSNQTLE